MQPLKFNKQLFSTMPIISLLIFALNIISSIDNDKNVTTDCNKYGGCFECKTDDSFYCYSCLKGYGFNKEGKCSKCYHNYCGECYENYSICTGCAPGYGLSKNENKEGNENIICKACSVSQCSECYDDYTICDTCKQNYGLIYENGLSKNQCESCKVKDCIICGKNSSQCESCKLYSGVKITDNLYECVKCDENCSICSENYTNCTLCHFEYGLVFNDDGTSTGICESCPDHCSECYDKRFCTSCKVKYGQIIDEQGNPTGQCGRCPKNCFICGENNNTCGMCNDDYGKFVDANGNFTGECEKCIENCTACDIYNFCKEGKCMDLFGPVLSEENKTFTGKCMHCPEHCESCQSDYQFCSEKCSHCDSNYEICNSCFDGYGYVLDENGHITKECKKCSENCAYCGYNYLQCEKCNDYYGFVIDKDGKNTGVCGQCPPNCKSCFTDNSLCSSCDKGYGYFVNNEGVRTNQCSPCPYFCQNCNQDSSNCSQCYDNFGFIRDENGIRTGKCGPCEDSFCAKCPTDNTKCVDCDYANSYGFIYDENGYSTGVCGKSPDNCDVCYNANVCHSCDFGYSLIGGICVSCPENCRYCDGNISDYNKCETTFGFYKNTTKCLRCEDENCFFCFEDNSKCTKCMTGFIMLDGKCKKCPTGCQSCKREFECNYCFDNYYMDTIEKTCKKCSEGCINCNSLNSCSECGSGYRLSIQRNSNVGTCIKCPSHCLQCDVFDNTNVCLKCEIGFKMQLSGQCGSCPENCAYCNGEGICNGCQTGFGFVIKNDINTGIYKSCIDENCIRCDDNQNLCKVCKEGFEVDVITYSPHYLKCIPKDYETDCKVENCMKSFYNLPNECSICKNGYQLNNDYQCKESLIEIERNKYEQINIEIESSQIVNGQLNLNTNNFDGTINNNNQQWLVQLPHPNENEDKITIELDNQNNENVAIKIIDGYSEITINSASANGAKFDIIPSTDSTLKINLDQSTFASIINAKGEIEINSTQNKREVKLNQVQPSSNFKLIVNTLVTIEEVEFSHSGRSLQVESYDDINNKVEIKSVIIQQKSEAEIKNAKIKGKVVFGLSSNLNVDKEVDLSDSILDIPFNDSYSQGFLDKAPINGYFGSIPNGIEINNRGINQILTEKRFLIAESLDEFNCEKWREKIEIKAIGTKFEDTRCTNNEINLNGKIVYRLYVQQKKQEDKGGKKLKPAEIAGIVIASVIVVGVIVFLLVYFLVIKKKKSNNSSSLEENNDNNADNEYY